MSKSALAKLTMLTPFLFRSATESIRKVLFASSSEELLPSHLHVLSYGAPAIVVTSSTSDVDETHSFANSVTLTALCEAPARGHGR